MRGLVRAVILPGAIVAAFSFLPAGCATDGDTGAGYIGPEDIDCRPSCSLMSPEQFRDALARLQTTRDLRADVFVGGAPEYAAVTPELRAVEHGVKCAVTDREVVAKLVALMSSLKYSPSQVIGVRPQVEVRFYRAGHASQRPVLEALFDWGFSGGPFREGAVITGIVNGHYVNVDYKSLSPLEDFASSLTDPDGAKMCETNKNK